MTQQTPHIQDHEHEPDLNDSEVCAIQGFIHEVKNEKLKAEEFYERVLTSGLDFGKYFTHLNVFFIFY